MILTNLLFFPIIFELGNIIMGGGGGGGIVIMLIFTFFGTCFFRPQNTLSRPRFTRAARQGVLSGGNTIVCFCVNFFFFIIFIILKYYVVIFLEFAVVLA